jgi:uncharacterized protein YjdB
MRSIHSVRALSAIIILATAGACSSESLGPATSGSTTVTVVPSLATIGEGQAVQLTAQLVDEFGDPLEATVAWSSSNPDVATVSVGGTVFGRREGRAAIIASAHGRAQTAAVQVLRDASGGKPRPPL